MPDAWPPCGMFAFFLVAALCALGASVRIELCPFDDTACTIPTAGFYAKTCSVPDHCDTTIANTYFVYNKTSNANCVILNITGLADDTCGAYFDYLYDLWRYRALTKALNRDAFLEGKCVSTRTHGFFLMTKAGQTALTAKCISSSTTSWAESTVGIVVITLSAISFLGAIIAIVVTVIQYTPQPSSAADKTGSSYALL